MAWKHIVYKLTFPDGMVYIGSTSNVKARWANGGAKYKGNKVWNAIQEFGWDSVKKECIIDLSPSVENEAVCLTVERELIKAYGDKSYNVLGTEENNTKRVEPLKSGFPKLFWTINGKTLSAAEWCRLYGKNQSAVMKRIKNHGLTPEQALSFPNVPIDFLKTPKEYWKMQGVL